MSVCGIMSGSPELQLLESHPWSGCAAWDLFPVWTPDVLCHETSRCCLSLDVGQKPSMVMYLLLFLFLFSFNIRILKVL